MISEASMGPAERSKHPKRFPMHARQRHISVSRRTIRASVGCGNDIRSGGGSSIVRWSGTFSEWTDIVERDLIFLSGTVAHSPAKVNRLRSEPGTMTAPGHSPLACCRHPLARSARLV